MRIIEKLRKVLVNALASNLYFPHCLLVALFKLAVEGDVLIDRQCLLPCMPGKAVWIAPGQASQRHLFRRRGQLKTNIIPNKELSNLLFRRA